MTADPGIRQHEQGDRQGRAYAEALIDTLQEGLLVLTAELRVETANASFYRMFGVDKNETENQLVFHLGNGQWDIPELRRLLEEVLPQDKVVEGVEVTHTFEDIGRRTMLLNARQLDHVQLVLVAIEDVTRARETETALQTLNETLEQKVKERTCELAHSELRFRQAFEMGPVAAAMTTLDEHFVEVNDSFLQLSGYERDEVVGHSAAELGMWSSASDRTKLDAAKQAGSFRELHLRVTDKAGALKGISVPGELIRIDEQEGWLKMFVDVTDQRRSEEELLSAVEEVMRDTSWFSRSVVEKLTNLRARVQDFEPATESQALTKRERQVLGSIAQGLNNDQISDNLGISRNTVRNYVAAVYSKLGVSSRAEAVVWARERGIVS